MLRGLFLSLRTAATLASADDERPETFLDRILDCLPEHNITIRPIPLSAAWRSFGRVLPAQFRHIDPIQAMRTVWGARDADFILTGQEMPAFLISALARIGVFNKPIIISDPIIDSTYIFRRFINEIVLTDRAACLLLSRAHAPLIGNAIGYYLGLTVDLNFFQRRSKYSTDEKEPRYVLVVGDDHGRDMNTFVDAIHSIDCRIIIRRSKNDFDHQRLRGVQIINERISYAALRALYEGAAMVVLPLKETENISGITTFVEALAMGCPTIVSGTRLMAEHLAPEACLTVPVGDAEAMRAAIIRLLADRRRAHLMSDAARYHAEQHWGRDEQMRRLATALVDFVCVRAKRQT